MCRDRAARKDVRVATQMAIRAFAHPRFSCGRTTPGLHPVDVGGVSLSPIELDLVDPADRGRTRPIGSAGPPRRKPSRSAGTGHCSRGRTQGTWSRWVSVPDCPLQITDHSRSEPKHSTAAVSQAVHRPIAGRTEEAGGPIRRADAGYGVVSERQDAAHSWCSKSSSISSRSARASRSVIMSRSATSVTSTR